VVAPLRRRWLWSVRLLIAKLAGERYMGPLAGKRQTKLQIVLIAGLALATGTPDALAQPPSPAAQPARTRFNLPAPGETRFVPNEVILDSVPTVSTPTLEAIAQRH